jgi:biotin carboxyl carrier protein
VGAEAITTGEVLSLDATRPGGIAAMNVSVSVDGRPLTIAVEPAGRPGDFAVAVDDRRRVVNATWIEPDTLSLLEAETSHEVRIHARPNGELRVEVGGRVFEAAIGRQSRRHISGTGDGKGAADTGSGTHYSVKAPMPGRVVRLLVAIGDRVHDRQGLVVVEAMKMENELRASRAGTVREIVVAAGTAVEAGAVLLVVGD